MKQQINITITKQDVYDVVGMRTEYQGAKLDVSLYDKVRIKSGDKALLETWWGEGCGLLTTMLVPWVTAVDSKTASFDMTVSMPGNWNQALAADLKASLKHTMEDYLTERWYQLLEDEAKTKAAGETLALEAKKVNELLYTRVRPTKPTYELD